MLFLTASYRGLAFESLKNEFAFRYRQALEREPELVRAHFESDRYLEDLYLYGENSEYIGIVKSASEIIKIAGAAKRNRAMTDFKRAGKEVSLDSRLDASEGFEKGKNFNHLDWEVFKADSERRRGVLTIYQSDPLDLLTDRRVDSILPLYEIARVVRKVYEEEKVRLVPLIQFCKATVMESEVGLGTIGSIKTLKDLTKKYDLKEVIEAILYYEDKKIRVPMMASLEEAEAKVDEVVELEGVSILDLMEDVLCYQSKASVRVLKDICERHFVTDDIIIALDYEYFKKKI